MDSEGGVLTMINDLRATGADPALIAFATEYWESFDAVMSAVNDIRGHYHLQVCRGERIFHSDKKQLFNCLAQFTLFTPVTAFPCAVSRLLPKDKLNLVCSLLSNESVINILLLLYYYSVLIIACRQLLV